MTHELDLKELRKVIEAGVTPGPWETVVNCDDEDLPETVAVGSGEYLASGGANYRANDLILEVDTSSYEEGHELDEVLRRAKFIATFDPPTVLALIEQADAAEQALDFHTQRDRELKTLLSMLSDRLDEFSYDELSSLIEDNPLDQWGESYKSRLEQAEAAIARVREALAEVQGRGERISKMENTGSIRSQERAARGNGYLEATRLAFRALDGEPRG